MKPVSSSSTSTSNVSWTTAIGRKIAALGAAIAEGAEAAAGEVVDVVTFSDDAKEKAKKKTE